jgi:hypothetical protein
LTRLSPCKECGAVMMNDEGEAKHLAWHARLDGLLEVIAQNFDALASK